MDGAGPRNFASGNINVDPKTMLVPSMYPNAPGLKYIAEASLRVEKIAPAIAVPRAPCSFT